MTFTLLLLVALLHNYEIRFLKIDLSTIKLIMICQYLKPN